MKEVANNETGHVNRHRVLAVGLGMAVAWSLTLMASGAHSQQAGPSAGRRPSIGGDQGAKRPVSAEEQKLLSLSRDKWRWMSERKVDSLNTLFHKDAVFVHMGGTMTRDQELGVIKTGGIQYKNAEIQEASVRVIGTTAILLNRIRLTAVVGGNEVVNPFVVTEVYVKQGGKWKLASLSFTRTMG